MTETTNCKYKFHRRFFFTRSSSFSPVRKLRLFCPLCEANYCLRLMLHPIAHPGVATPPPVRARQLRQCWQLVMHYPSWRGIFSCFSLLFFRSDSLMILP